MKQKERIDKMEKILNNSTKLLEELEEILNKLDEDSKNYNELLKYYYSKNWAKDKEDFEKDLLPDVEAAGVLTEDSIYDMMTTSSGLAIQMLELATIMLKVSDISISRKIFVNILNIRSGYEKNQKYNFNVIYIFNFYILCNCTFNW